jgi:hypothetical protein
MIVVEERVGQRELETLLGSNRSFPTFPQTKKSPVEVDAMVRSRLEATKSKSGKAVRFALDRMASGKALLDLVFEPAVWDLDPHSKMTLSPVVLMIRTESKRRRLKRRRGLGNILHSPSFPDLRNLDN